MQHRTVRPCSKSQYILDEDSTLWAGHHLTTGQAQTDKHTVIPEGNVMFVIFLRIP